MRSSQKATITFVAILLLFLLSFVSAELNKRDPQAPGDAPPAGDGGKAPAGDAPPAGDAGGKAPAGGAPPAGDAGGKAPAGGAPPAGDAGGKAPAGGAPAGGGGKAPAGDAPAAPGGNQPGGDPQAGGANNSTVPKYIDPSTPTVQVVITDPKSSKNILYKIGAKITFKWGYSDKFLDPPKYITVAAQPQVNTKTNYTIAPNMTLGETQEVIWDTSLVPSLPMSQYKLIICDQDGVNAPPKPGGLQSFSNLQFGLYPPQDPSNYCASCNNAISIPVISLLSTIGLALITIISFNFISI